MGAPMLQNCQTDSGDWAISNEMDSKTKQTNNVLPLIDGEQISKVNSTWLSGLHPALYPPHPHVLDAG